MEHYTSIEQGKKLVELGLNPETADMCYLPTHLGEEHHWIASLASPVEVCKCRDIDIMHCIPCWSVGALLELLPEEIKYQDEWCSLEFAKDWISYEGCDKYDASYWIQPFAFDKKPFIELLFDSIVWLLENGYIKKGE